MRLGSALHEWLEATIIHISLHPWQWLGFLLVFGIGLGMGGYLMQSVLKLLSR